MDAGRIICALALVAGTSGPLLANSSARECRTVAALTSGKASDLAKVSIRYNRSGTIDLLTSGKPDSLTGANGCELIGPIEELSVDCEWKVETEAEARALIGQMRERLIGCTPSGFTGTDNRYATDTYVVHRSEKAKFELDDYEEIVLEMQMVEIIHSGISRYRVRFAVER